MTGPDSAGPPPDAPDAPEAQVRRRRFSLIWLVPIAAAAIAVYLGWRTASTHGPVISISFHTADGLVSGQTSVKYKAVDLGTVESIRISDDRSHVVVGVRMRSEADPYLTDRARFWVVRPRLTGGNITGLETLVSGAYIELDPGAPGGKSRRDFVGLERPPSVRSDEPGTTFVLEANRIGALGIGAPVFFRDVPVGEVLSYDPPGLGGDIIVHAFIRKPYDGYVRAGSRFWSASGARLELGRGGVKLQMQSLQALISGGVAFDTPPSAFDEPPAPSDTAFKLYADEDAAVSADAPDRLSFVMYFEHSVRGLATGSPVLFYGQRVGSVTDVRLQYDTKTRDFRVPVHISVNPDPIALATRVSPPAPQAVARELVARGLHARVETANYLTGQLVVNLSLGKKGPARVTSDGGAVVLPADAAGLDTLVDSVNDVVAKLNGLPLEEIADNLNKTLVSLNGVASSPDLKRSLQSLSRTLATAQDLVQRADKGMTPVLQRLPAIADDLQQTVKHANGVVDSVDRGYGRDSEFRRNLDRLMAQLNDTARSIRLLADFLNRHPEALIRGRSGKAMER